jgi:hypothetical protein
VLNRFRRSIIACTLLYAAAPAFAITADEIIASNVTARGGADKLQAISSIKREGHLIVPGANYDIRASTLVVRGGKVRNEYTLQGLTAVDALDGKDAWRIDPFQGRKDPARMSADEAKPLVLQSDMDLPLVDYRAKGHTVEYLGLEEVDGTPAYKVRVHLKTGDEVLYYIDPDTFMVIRDVQKQFVRGAEQETETDYGEYEKVNGVYVPMTEDSGPKNSDSSQKQQLVFDKAEANIAVDAAVFAYPAAH